jgi:hypothetical protein
MAVPEILVVSFVPLLRAPAGYHLTEQERECFLERLHAAPAVRGLVWVHAGDGFIPVFAMERGREVAEHLVEWSEGKPADWFHLYIEQTPNRYRVALIPDVQKSIERYRTSRRVLHGDVVPADARFKVIFSAIDFVSVDRGVIDAIPITPTMRVGILDWSDITPGTLDVLEAPIYAGPFRVNPPDQPLDRLGVPMSPTS